MTASDHEAAFAEILRAEQNADPAVVVRLVEAQDERIDAYLLERFRNPDLKLEAAFLISRILIARDPDRDPDYIVTHLQSWAEFNPFASKARRRAESALSNPFMAGCVLGFPRLRRADPVGVYARQLGSRFLSVRLSAAAGLSDTADVAALRPLSRALRDRHWRVRMVAADSVRRLRHLGADELLADRPVRDGLIRCLSDRRHKVRVAAARALGSMGDLEPVRKRRWRSVRSWPEFGRVLRGEIPPLPKLWTCDDTV